MRRLTGALAGALVGAAPAVAHDAEAHTRAIGWTFGGWVTVPLALTLLVYLCGLARLRGRARRGRDRLLRRVPVFLAGWAVLAGALVSPLHQAGEVSFTMHMIEHELIMLPATLLLAAARPGPVLLWGLPAALRRIAASVARWTVWRTLAAPTLATGVQAAVLIAWHMPALFDRALRSTPWHIAQHASFVVAALLFWRAMLPRPNGSGNGDRATALVAAMCLLLTTLIGGGLGALMAVAASPWYAGYAALGMTPFGLSPAEDQQLAGLVMWVPGGLFHAAAALVLLASWLRSAPERLDDRIACRDKAA